MPFRLLRENKSKAFHLAEQMLYLQLANGSFATRRRRAKTNWRTVHRNTVINVVGTAHHFDGPVGKYNTFAGRSIRSIKRTHGASQAYLLINTMYLSCIYEVDEDIVPLLRMSKAVNQIGERGMKFWSPGMGLGDVFNNAIGEVVGAVTGGTNDMLIAGDGGPPGSAMSVVGDLMKKTGGSAGALRDIGTGTSTGVTGLMEVLSPIKTEILAEQQFLAIRRCNLILKGGDGHSGEMRVSTVANVQAGPTSRALAMAVTDTDDPVRNRTNYITNPFSEDPSYVPNQRTNTERPGLPDGYWINEQVFHARQANGRTGWVTRNDTRETGEDRNYAVSETPPSTLSFTEPSDKVKRAFRSSRRHEAARDDSDADSGFFSGSTQTLSADSSDFGSGSYSASSSDSV